MPLNSPLDIPNCKVWLDMSDLTTLSGLSAGSIEEGNFRPLANNDFVGFIGDKSNNSNHFTNFSGTTASRPVLINNVQNSRSLLRFYGTNYLTGIFNLPITNQTVFAVASRRMLANLSTGRVYTQTASGPDTTSQNHYIPISVEGTVTAGDGNGFSSYINSGFQATVTIIPPQLSSLDVFTSVLCSNAAQSRVFTYLGGLSSASYLGNPGRSTSYNVSASRLGASIGLQISTPPTTFTYLTGDIGEIIVYDRALSREERTSVEWYLANKWNLPLTFYAINSGNWSDEAIWSVSGTPLPRSDVFSNGYQINLDQDINVRGLLGIHAVPQNTRSNTGTFNLIRPFNIIAPVSGIRAGNNIGLFITTTATNNFSISGNILGGLAAHSHGVSISGIGSILTVFGNISGGNDTTAAGLVLSGDITSVSPKLDVNVFGDIIGRTGSGLTNCSTDYIGVTGNLIRGGSNSAGTGINNAAGGGFYIFSNVVGGTVSNAHGIRNSYNGFITLVGNITGGSGAAGFVNNNGLVDITGDLIATNNVAFDATLASINSVNTTQSNFLNCRFFYGSGGAQPFNVKSFYIDKKPNNFLTNVDRTYTVQNILSSSEKFTDPNWSQPFLPVTVTPNTNYAPSNPLDILGTTLQTTNGTGIFAIRRQFNPPISTANTRYTFSVFASENATSTKTMYLELFAITPISTFGAVYNLNTGQTVFASPSALTDNYFNYFSNDTGYRRFGLTFPISSSSQCFVEIRLTESTSLSQHTTGTGTERINIWGAQLQREGITTGYVATSDTVPSLTGIRLYNPSSVDNEGPDKIIFYDSNNFIINNLPSTENVRAGVSYAGFNDLGITTSLTGRLVIPPKESVKLGTLVDNTTGVSILGEDDFLELWKVSNDVVLVPDNTLGYRLYNIAPIISAGSVLANINL